MALSGSVPPTSGFTLTGGDGTAGMHIVPEPPGDLAIMVADLFQTTVVTPSLPPDDVQGHLLATLRYLLAARRILILHRDKTDAPHSDGQRYEAQLADRAGRLHNIGQSASVQAAPLPLVRALATGVLIEHPQQNRQVDPAVAELLGPTPALLLALPRERCSDDDILALSLGTMPHSGEMALALVLVRRAAMTLSSDCGDEHVLVRGGRAVSGRDDQRRAASRSHDLSPREREVVHLVAAGLRNKEIAKRLKIKEKTVKFHLGQIFDKLGVDSRTEVLLRAIATGLIGPRELPSEAGDPEAPSS